MNAHTSDGDVAPAAMTSSLVLPGNFTRVQVLPLRSHAAGTSVLTTGFPLNAQAVVFPVATTAVKSPVTPLCTDLTMCHDGGADAVPAAAVTLPSASSPATPAATAKTLPAMMPPILRTSPCREYLP